MYEWRKDPANKAEITQQKHMENTKQTCEVPPTLRITSILARNSETSYQQIVRVFQGGCGKKNAWNDVV
jgi:hypothetical protein